MVDVSDRSGEPGGVNPRTLVIAAKNPGLTPGSPDFDFCRLRHGGSNEIKMRPPKVAFIAPREVSRKVNDAIFPSFSVAGDSASFTRSDEGDVGGNIT